MILFIPRHVLFLHFGVFTLGVVCDTDTPQCEADRVISHVSRWRTYWKRLAGGVNLVSFWQCFPTTTTFQHLFGSDVALVICFLRAGSLHQDRIPERPNED